MSTPKLHQEQESESDKTIQEWRDQLLPTMMTIVTQSFRVNGHNYSLESIFLVRNLARMRGYPTTGIARFIREELATWSYKKTDRGVLGCQFPVDEDPRVAVTIKHMHETIRMMSGTLQKFQVSQESLVFEIKGTNKYVANTWERCSIVALGYEVFSYLFTVVASSDVSLSRQEERENCILHFAHDVMILEGQVRISAITFLEKVCVCFGSTDVDGVMGQQRTTLQRCWDNRDEDGPIMFVNHVLYWFQAITELDLEHRIVASSLDIVYRYVAKRNSGLKMSLQQFKKRKNSPGSCRNTASPPEMSRQQLLDVFSASMRNHWWNFIASKVYRMFLDRKKNQRIELFRQEVYGYVARPDTAETKRLHGLASLQASKQNESTPVEENKMVTGNTDSGDRKASLKQKESPPNGNKQATGRKASLKRKESPPNGNKKSFVTRRTLPLRAPFTKRIKTVSAMKSKEEESHTGSGSESDSATTSPSKQDSEGDMSEAEEGKAGERQSLGGSVLPSGSESDSGHSCLSTKDTKCDMGNSSGGGKGEGLHSEADEDGEDTDCDSIFSFDTVPTDDTVARGFRNARKSECAEVMAEYVVLDDDNLHYLEWCDQIVSIHREFENRHGPRFSTFSHFPKDQDNTKAETCLRNGIPYFKTQRMCGIRVNKFQLPMALEEVSDRIGVIDHMILMNFLVRMTGSKVYKSNLPDSDLEAEGRVRHLKLRLTDLPEDTGLLMKGPFLNEVSKVARFCWAAHKHFHQAEEAERMENASESFELRKLLLADPATEGVGFSDGTVEFFEPAGGVEWDASQQFINERYPDKYLWTMLFTMSVTREIDGRLFLVLFKFHYGKWSVYDRM